MIRLNKSQVQKKIDFINHYIHPDNNAAQGSKLDPNANVTSKNVATLEAEINKDINIQVNRALVANKIEEIFDADLAEEYHRMIEAHEIYVHDETSLKPYCASVSMYPFLTDGLTKLGGESKAPKHLNSFCGSFVNFVFAVSSQFAGAVATVEFFLYFDYFARKDYGDDYLTTYKFEVENHLQHVVYAINQPAAARGYQSVFWNVSLYDSFYFESMFQDFAFPDEEFTRPEWQSVRRLQEFFLKWINKEREASVLTFPVITTAMLVDEEGPRDKDFAWMLANELEEGNSFFIYQSKTPDSLSSCCRLRSEISDNTFSYTLGAGGVATGSINVITLNMNRLIQDGKNLKHEVKKIQKFQVAYRKLIEDYIESNMLTVYDAGFIFLDKQFLTLGINGMVEAAEWCGISADNNEEYIDFCSSLLKTIYDANKVAKKEYGYLFNTEFVPAENLGIKNAKWDAIDGYGAARECYNSYFYPVEDDTINAVDKFVLHGEKIIQYLDGGSALHLNLDDYLAAEQYMHLFNISAKAGCNYFTINVKITICNECDHIDKRTNAICTKCGSVDIDYATRIIGYLKRISSWSNDRQKEAALRHYHTE